MRLRRSEGSGATTPEGDDSEVYASAKPCHREKNVVDEIERGIIYRSCNKVKETLVLRPW